MSITEFVLSSIQDGLETDRSKVHNIASHSVFCDKLDSKNWSEVSFLENIKNVVKYFKKRKKRRKNSEQRGKIEGRNNEKSKKKTKKTKKDENSEKK